MTSEKAVSSSVNVDELLKGITSSFKSTKESIVELNQLLKSEDDIQHLPAMIQTLLSKINTKSIEGVSLLSLKNESLLSYVNNLVLVVLGQLEKLEESGENNNEEVEVVRNQIIERSIVQRVTLEKGIKPLEKKLNYQLDKMVRAYTRMENDEQKLESKLNKRENNNDGDEDDDEDDEDSSEEEDDALSYRPDAAALAKLNKKDIKNKKSSNGDDTKESKEKYRPPKISAVVAPSTNKNDIDKGGKSGGKNKKLQSMEEYLNEQSDLPSMESSIGSTIIDHGRGGVKTQFEKKKEAEIQNYEESNFIRLPNNQTKKSFKQKQRDSANTFGGEDWSMFNGNDNDDNDVKSGTSRKRKAASAWDRAKKRNL
ncbi:nucleolar protein required for ribosomal RNA processing [Scheffersomyces coipomensis]|uniref:nucleolar protein required for ribosomal RNA processing n=1 Tax=Scheffersomyces coipomensis TaxID=1788519 RepID=UPI00315C529C